MTAESAPDRSFQRRTLIAVGVALLLCLLILRALTTPRPVPPTAAFESAGNPLNPLEVWFDPSASSAEAGDQYTWDFGDGITHTSDQVKFPHVYEQAGEYTVRLTISRADAAPDTVQKTVTVTPPEQFPPHLTNIEPADGAELSGGDAWIQWETAPLTEGRVLWHRVGESAVQIADAEFDDVAEQTERLTARLADVTEGVRYEYVIEQTASGQTQRSELRTFSVSSAGVTFDPPTVTATVVRDYAQIVTLMLRNTSNEPVTVGAHTISEHFDLPADVIGRGSADSPVTLEAGGNLPIQLAVTATDATRTTYEIPVHAAGATALVTITVNDAPLNLNISEVNTNPFTLAKTIEVTNEGGPLTDLAIGIAPPFGIGVRLQPTARHMSLEPGETFRFVATPALSVDFTVATVNLEFAAAGQTQLQPVRFAPPPNTRLYGVRTGMKTDPTVMIAPEDSQAVAFWQGAPGRPEQESSDAKDRYCVNRPASGTCIDSPPATGPVNMPTPVEGPFGPVGEPIDPNEISITAVAFLDDNSQSGPGSYTGTCGDRVRLWKEEIRQHVQNAAHKSAPCWPSNCSDDVNRLILGIDRWIRDELSGIAKGVKQLREELEPIIETWPPRDGDDRDLYNDLRKKYLDLLDCHDNLSSTALIECGMFLDSPGPSAFTPLPPDLWYEASGSGDGRQQPTEIARDEYQGIRRSDVSERQKLTPASTVAVLSDALPPAPIPEELLQRLRDRAQWLNLHDGPLPQETAGNDLQVIQFLDKDQAMVVVRCQGGIVAHVGDRFSETAVSTLLSESQGLQSAARRGNNAIVAWSDDDLSACRLFKDRVWSDETVMPGVQADVTIGANGAVYAATTDGLFVLRDGTCEWLLSREMHEPTVATDATGTPLTAWVEDGEIYVEGSQVASGREPSLLVDTTGDTVVAYLDGDDIVVRRNVNGEWSAGDLIHAPGARNPTLAMGPDGVRLTFCGPADAGPEALWLVSLPDTEPILVPSVAGNVSDAWLTMEFHSSEGSDRHDTVLTFNNRNLATFDDTRMDGRYLFRLNPQDVSMSPGEPAPNHIGMYTWNINRGRYSGTRNFRLTVRKAWDEHFVFAASAEAARSAVLNLDEQKRPEADDVGAVVRRTRNQGAADLAVFSNRVNLPDEIPESGAVDLPVDVVNLGLVPSGESTLVMRYGEEEEEEEEEEEVGVEVATIPVLESDETYSVTVRLTTQEQQVRFKIRPSTPDFDSSNDTLELALWDAYQWESWEGRTGGTAPSESKHELRPLVNDVRPYWVENGLPEAAEPSGREPWVWDDERTLGRFSSHFAPPPPNGGRSLHYFLDAADNLPLAPGDNLIQYVYLDADNPPQQILLRGYYDGKHEGQGVYWGGIEEDDQILVGGEVANRLGDLPETGTWVRLKIPVSELGIENSWFDGLLFGTYGGRAWWGPTAKSIERLDPSPSMMIVDDAVETSGGAN